MNQNLFSILTLGLMLTFVVASAEQNKGAAEIKIVAGDKGDINFPHRKHQTTLGDCNKCHNLFPQEAGSIKEYQSKGKLQKKQVMDQCRECHKTMSAAGEKTGPTNCNQCHQK